MKKFTYLFSVFMMLSFFANAQCEAFFVYQQNPATNEISFLDSSQTSGNIIAWYWDFGDGTTSEDQSTSHIYNRDGIYNICLTIFATDSCESTYCVDSVLVGTGYEPDPCENASLSYLVSPTSTNNSADGSIDLTVTGLNSTSFDWSNNEQIKVNCQHVLYLICD